MAALVQEEIHKAMLLMIDDAHPGSSLHSDNASLTKGTVGTQSPCHSNLDEAVMISSQSAQRVNETSIHVDLIPQLTAGKPSSPTLRNQTVEIGTHESEPATNLVNIGGVEDDNFHSASPMIAHITQYEPSSSKELATMDQIVEAEPAACKDPLGESICTFQNLMSDAKSCSATTAIQRQETSVANVLPSSNICASTDPPELVSAVIIPTTAIIIPNNAAHQVQSHHVQTEKSNMPSEDSSIMKFVVTDGQADSASLVPVTSPINVSGHGNPGDEPENIVFIDPKSTKSSSEIDVSDAQKATKNHSFSHNPASDVVQLQHTEKMTLEDDIQNQSNDHLLNLDVRKNDIQSTKDIESSDTDSTSKDVPNISSPPLSIQIIDHSKLPDDMPKVSTIPSDINLQIGQTSPKESSGMQDSDQKILDKCVEMILCMTPNPAPANDNNKSLSLAINEVLSENLEQTLALAEIQTQCTAGDIESSSCQSTQEEVANVAEMDITEKKQDESQEHPSDNSVPEVSSERTEDDDISKVGKQDSDCHTSHLTPRHSFRDYEIVHIAEEPSCPKTIDCGTKIRIGPASVTERELVQCLMPKGKMCKNMMWLLSVALMYDWGSKTKLILDQTIILFLLTLSDNHWILAIINLTQNTIEIYDSNLEVKEGEDPHKVMLENMASNLQKSLNDCLQKSAFAFTDFPKKYCYAGKQTNNDDCGFWVIKVLLCHNGKELIGNYKWAMDVFRKEICYILVYHRFNDLNPRRPEIKKIASAVKTTTD
ncbi:hypothetical protein VPH35_055325 [Triticum aestivum]|uniref:Ubiquitin-like protease family profile domain-containing protein n=1 Tax=Triticum aestivum TaxID=4565 RepID=A0A077S441_WHEAT|nr:unnamed protein product [Triticum aestivum]